MAKISGEAKQNPQSKKWGYVISHEDSSILTESDYIFDTQEKAEDELIKFLQGLGKHSQNS